MSDENPEPWNADHPQKEDWPPGPSTEDALGGVKSCLFKLGLILLIPAAIVIIIIWMFIRALMG